MRVEFLKLKLTQFFAELTTAENMEVQMVHGLAGIGAAVGNNAVAVADAGAGSDERNVFENISDFVAGFLGDVLNGIHVHFRDDKNVDGGLGVQVLEGKDLIVFINFGAGNESCGDFTKNTILHGISPFFL